MHITIHNESDIDRHTEAIRRSRAATHRWLHENAATDPLAMFRQMKFEKVGLHPIDNRSLNFIEQINQTLTFAVALEATRQLLKWHGGEAFKLAPGAHAAIELDIMSKTRNLVGAEVFAAVTPRNNGKLKKDLQKLASRSEKHRYVFFMSPAHPETQRLKQYEIPEVEVWSIKV